MKNYGKIAVLYGGCSAEREVSLRSGARVLQGLKNLGLDAHGIDVQDDVVTRLITEKFDRVFNVLHGPEGEDGTVRGLLDMLKIPCTGPSVLGSAVTMNQLQCLILWRGVGLPVPDFVDCQQADVRLIEHLTLPIAIKPSNQGSSVGVTKLKSFDDFAAAFQHAEQYGPVIAQKWIEGKEYAVSIVGDAVLPPVWIEPAREFYDYIAKCDKSSGTQYHCPCNLDAASEQRMQQLAKQAFDITGCSGWGRVDVLCNKQGEYYLLEANPVPGMTELSLVPRAAQVNGWSFETLLLKIMEASY